MAKKQFIVVNITIGYGNKPWARPTVLGDAFSFQGKTAPAECKRNGVLYCDAPAQRFRSRRAAQRAIQRTVKFAKVMGLVMWPQTTDEMHVIEVSG